METIYSAIKFQNENGRFIPYLNEEFKNKLINSKNPKIVMVIGKAREGKSTALNHLLFDKTLDIPKKLRKISSPFPSKGGENAITKEFLFYGPIKASELCRRNKIEFEEEDFDYFFVDTEGIENFYKMSEILYQGVFSLESITSCILFVSKGTIDEEGILYISRHIQASKLLNSTSDNSFPGLAVISRDVGIEDEDDYDSDDEIILNKLDSIRITQDTLKLNEIKERLNINTGIIFSENNLKYVVEPHFDMSDLYLNSIRDLCKFIIKNSKNQSFKIPEDIFDKFKKYQDLIGKFQELLNTEVSMEEFIKNIFSIKLQEIENKIKKEDENLIIKKINSLNLQNISNIQKESYINDILMTIEKKFEDETNSRYQGMKRVIEEQYNLALIDLKDHFKSFIIALFINLEKLGNKNYSLIFACKKNDIEKVKFLINHANKNNYILNINEKDNDGNYPLLLATLKNNNKMVKLLIEYGTNKKILLDVNEKNNDGLSPLIYACINGNENIVKLLIENGADINIEDNQGYTPFTVACIKEDKNLITCLIDLGVNIFYKNKNGKTTLEIVNNNENENIIKYIKDKMNIENIPYNIQSLNWEKSVYEYNNEKNNENGIFDDYLTKNNKNTDIKNDRKNNNNLYKNVYKEDEDGNTPLINACRENNESQVKLLIENGANINMENEDGETPLTIACKYDNINIVRILIENGVDINKENKN